MSLKTITAIAAGGLLATTVAAGAQTLGIGSTKAGFTNQAGAAISKVVSLKTPLQMRAQTFGGSSAYVPAVSAGQLEFGLANQLETVFAVGGTAIYKGRPQKGLRIAAVLVPFRTAMFSRKGSDIKTVKDLKGKRVPSGWASQKIIGVLMNGYLANGGLTYDDVVKVPVPNVVGSANDFAAGNADVFFFAFGSGKVKETAARVGGIQVVGISSDPAAVARMRKHVPPGYPMLVKPSKANVGVVEPVNVMAYDYLMLTSTKVSDDVVYKVVKAMHDNKPDLARSFAALRAFNPQQMAKTFPGVDYHPGAIKYYKEIGQWPPK